MKKLASLLTDQRLTDLCPPMIGTIVLLRVKNDKSPLQSINQSYLFLSQNKNNNTRD